MPSGKEIMSAQLGERRIPVALNADATTPTLLAGGNQVTLTRNGVGDYTLTFKSLHQYTRAPWAHITGLEDNAMGRVGTRTVSAIQILIEDASTNAPADLDVFIDIVGWDRSDEI